MKGFIFYNNNHNYLKFIKNKENLKKMMIMKKIKNL